ncbi:MULTISPECIES: DNA adenine methylase [unclassified Rhizobium]|uniref:DNA adenine methylase n=1 Tax=unclassified Rhizobium TaxID=2613769 RepID=UPI001FD07A58|nr:MULTISPECIES: DNA adenine methylase [unclassified Rhizobium]
MGSKRSMLLNGLGETIQKAIPGHTRFIDMFSGSGSVSWHVANKYSIPVLAADLQFFSVALAEGVLSRTHEEEYSVLEDWIFRAAQYLEQDHNLAEAKVIQGHINDKSISGVALSARALSAEGNGPINKAYGGYYYSTLQSMWLDALRATLPVSIGSKAICQASLIWAASSCAASPGHTAQPFKPNETAGRFLADSWKKSIPHYVTSAFGKINGITAKRIGTAVQQDANELALMLKEGDLAFLDPPYSGVHYSRFYHVLETLVINERVEVSGSGRYPPPEARPKSKYSMMGTSTDALKRVLSALSEVGANAIITFPAGKASNGLSGDQVKEIAATYYKIKFEKVSGRFSTLGGNSRNRNARAASEELILVLQN